MAANVIWKTTNMISGMATPLENVAARESGVIPLRNALERPPKKGLPPVNATLYP